MTIRIGLFVLVLAAAAALSLPPAALASKEKFVRDKPHLNIASAMLTCLMEDSASGEMLVEPVVQYSSNFPQVASSSADNCADVLAKLRSIGARCATSIAGGWFLASCEIRSAAEPGGVD